MKKYKIWILTNHFLAAFVFLLLQNVYGTEYTWIGPDHSEIQYTGRIDFSDTNAPSIYWPGTSIRANFTGTSLQIMLDDEKGESYYHVIIDKNESDPVILDCQPGLHIYSITDNLTDGSHDLLIFRRTEASTGSTIFRGIIVDKYAQLSKAPERQARKIEFYGNSITCAMGNEAHPDSSDDNMAEENNYLSYAAITARSLDAEYVCIAKSGIGIMVSWFDLVMPNYYYRLNPADPESKWDFNLSQPDVVVINLFQNDSWLFDKRLDPVPGKDDIISAYIRFVSMIRDKYSEAYILCTLGTMDAITEGKPWPEYVRKAVEIIKNMGDKNIDAYIFEYQGYNAHPRVVHHKKMAEELTQFIRQKLNW